MNVKIQYLILLVTSIALTAISYRLNQKAFLNNVALYQIIIGEDPAGITFSDTCQNHIARQLAAARKVGAYAALVDSFAVSAQHPAHFLKKLQDITYLQSTSNDHINITPEKVTASLTCGNTSPVRIVSQFERKNGKLICTDISGVDLLMKDVSRAFK